MYEEIWLLASALTTAIFFITAFGVGGQKIVFKQDEDKAIMVGTMFALIGGACGGISIAEYGYSSILFILWFMALALLPIIAVKAFRKAKLESPTKELIASQRDAVVARLKTWHERENKVLRDAKRRAAELCALIPELPWDEYRRLINQVAHEFLPELYTQAQELRDEIAQIGEIIAEYRKKKLDDFSRSLLEKSIADKQELETALTETETQITACRSFLDHIKSDLLVARRRGTGLPELRARFEQLTQGVEATSREVVKARQEVDDLDDRRVVNLPTRPRQRTPQ